MEITNPIDISNGVSKDLDCYGLLYDPFIHPCKDKCAIRFDCKAQLQKIFKEEGEEELKKKQEKVVSANHSANLADHNPESVNMTYSPLVLEAIKVCKEAGLKPVQRKAYLALKIGSMTLLSITRFKSETLDKIIKFIHEPNISELPDIVLSKIHPEKIKDFYFAKLNSIEELRELLESYLKCLKK